MKAYQVKVEGRVQGVSFRYYTQAEADRLGISGWVRNCSDGSVEALICGDDTKVEEMLAWLRHGPSAAIVNQIDVHPVPAAITSTGFNITY